MDGSSYFLKRYTEKVAHRIFERHAKGLRKREFVYDGGSAKWAGVVEVFSAFTAKNGVSTWAELGVGIGVHANNALPVVQRADLAYILF